MQEEKKHSIAAFDADGGMQIIEVDEIRVCIPTAKCIKFWATFASCIIGIGVGIFLMVFQGANTAYFATGTSLLSLCFGILIPAPEYKAILPKKVKIRSRPSTPLHEPAPSNHHADTEPSDLAVDIDAL